MPWVVFPSGGKMYSGFHPAAHDFSTSGVNMGKTRSIDASMWKEAVRDWEWEWKGCDVEL
jgi:hypothetical protein